MVDFIRNEENLEKRLDSEPTGKQRWYQTELISGYLMGVSACLLGRVVSGFPDSDRVAAGYLNWVAIAVLLGTGGGYLLDILASRKNKLKRFFAVSAGAYTGFVSTLALTEVIKDLF